MDFALRGSPQFAAHTTIQKVFIYFRVHFIALTIFLSYWLIKEEESIFLLVILSGGLVGLVVLIGALLLQR
jgi:hypothetical protein